MASKSRPDVPDQTTPWHIAWSIADIAPFCIGNGEHRRNCLQILDGLCKALPAFRPVTFVKGKIGLVGDGEIMRGIDDRLVEFKNRILGPEKMRRNL